MRITRRGRSYGSTRTAAVEYDSLGRLTRSRETESDGSVVQRTAHIYDSANRLTSQSWQIGARSYSESYAYDSADGKLTGMTTAAGTNISLTYDLLKRVKTETSKNGTTTLFTRTYTYPLLSSSNQSTMQISETAYKNAAGTTLLGYAYAYNAQGNITKISDSASGYTLSEYAYDSYGRLTQEKQYSSAGALTIT